MHVADGQLSLLNKTRAISDILADPDTPQKLSVQLEQVDAIRRYAFQQLLLPESDSYSKYADVGRPWVVKNLFASPELSLKPVSWCYPILGCASYRGFFDETRLQDFVQQLEQQGHDVYISNVSAYSTLGWFDDPVLNTFVFWPETSLAGLIFHELAHQLLYVEADSRFNESFATAVQQIGIQRWLHSKNRSAQLKNYQQRLRNRRQVLALIEQSRDQLATVYASTDNEPQKRDAKQRIIRQLKSDYQSLAANFQIKEGYARWFERDINNAQLAAISTYQHWVPAFLSIYQDSQEQLPIFYERVRLLAEMAQDQRDFCIEQWISNSSNITTRCNLVIDTTASQVTAVN